MTSLGRTGSVEFRFYRPAADSVALAGDFNGWSTRFPMRRDAKLPGSGATAVLVGGVAVAGLVLLFVLGLK